ncbi:dihydroneopterin aldolase [Candidatus Pantoea carbekii]|uniref:7,8-dihydroneopterin aldolase n=1 Tax=Candidatus Pantoea carbekii TaxID=1235990 RepID=U3U7M3_9GAMM|nr:dihydroneopterin aldolase [Candidatus Pantoea carbekii]AKC32546.1 dihydroneopterin aldolase FolB [Candidatus Pantoea carbekii]BAO00274.1 FolB protein [Candidatus Pantoea carbekii]
MDMVYIEQLTVFTTIGVHAWEQNITQKLLIDIQMTWDNHLAAVSDNVNHCLNYNDVKEAILIHVQNKRFNLIERVAEEIANLLIKRFKSPIVRVRVAKPGAIAQAENVGVCITRSL